MIIALAIPFLALAYIEPETIVYEQGGQCYNILAPVEVHDFNLGEPESGTATSSDVVVSVKKVCADYRDRYCSCMSYLKLRGIVVSQKNASDLQPNYFGSPFKGDVAIFHYPNIAHASFVEEVYLKSFLVSEWNYYAGKYSERVIQKDDPYLIGFIHKVSAEQNPI